MVLHCCTTEEVVPLAVSEGESLKSRDASRNVPVEKPGTAGDLPNLGRQIGEGTLLSVS